MRYYRVHTYHGFMPWNNLHCLVKGEIFTEREYQKYALDRIKSYLEPIEVKRGRVCFAFGARFPMDGAVL